MKAIKYFSCIVLLVISSRIYSQIPDTIWTKTFGGSNADGCYSGQSTNDEGYIITGYTRSFGSNERDVWLIKTNSFGDTLWTKTFGGSNDDIGYSVQQTTDGGYIITGNTLSFGAGSNDVLLIKTDSSSNIQWTKTFGGMSPDGGRSVQQTIDGGYILTGSTKSFGAGAYDVWLLKTDSFGDTLWTKTFGGIADDGGRSIQQTSDGGYIIVGYTISFSAGLSDVWLIKTDASGEILWTKTFGGSDGEGGYSVEQTSDSGYVLTGANMGDVWLIKTNALGDTLWTKTFGGSNEDIGLSVQPTKDNGYIVTGYTLSFGSGNNDVWLIKTDAFGDTLWTKIFGGSVADIGYSVEQTESGGYTIFGFTGSFGAGAGDVWLLRLESDLPANVQIDFFPAVDTALVSGGCTTPEFTCKNLVSTNYKDSISIEPGFNTYFYYFDSSGTQIPLDNYYFLVIDSLNEYDYELWFHPKSYPPFDPVLIEFDSTFFSDRNNFNIQLVVKKDGLKIDSLSQPFHADFGLSVDDSGIIPNEFSLSQNFPNPFNPVSSIQYAIGSRQFVTLKVYDILGKEVTTLVNEEKQPGTYEVEFNIHSDEGRNLSSGIYFYQLQAGNYLETKKMVLIK